MKFNLKFFCFLFFTLTTLTSVAQEETEELDDEDKPTLDNSPLDKNYFLFSVRANITVPHATSNKSFRKTFVGIYEVGGDLDVMLYKGLYAGGTYKNSLMKITANKISGLNVSMQVNNVAGKIGADIFIGEKNRMIFSGSITIGKNFTNYVGLVSNDPSKPPLYTSFSTTYEEPALHIYFLTEENFGIGATLSYTIFNHTFDPYELKLSDWSAYEQNPSGSTQLISFGFGFYYNFVKKHKR